MSLPSLILGSSSPYRRETLARMGLDCEQVPPLVDEQKVKAELPDGVTPARLAGLLAEVKARAVAEQIERSTPWVVIGSDQVCHLDGEPFSKPGSVEKAKEHLSRFSGQWVTFSTGLCLISSEGREICQVEDFHCHFRVLSDTEISDYVALDQPLDCAGAIKAEAAGMTLMDDTRGRDINTLLGLPVMLLRESLEVIGFHISDFRNSL